MPDKADNTHEISHIESVKEEVCHKMPFFTPSLGDAHHHGKGTYREHRPQNEPDNHNFYESVGISENKLEHIKEPHVVKHAVKHDVV